MLSLVCRMNFVFTLVLAALASDGVLHGQEGSERKPLSEALAGLRKGGISDENLAQLDAIAQSDSPKAALARQIACLSRLQRGDYRSVWSVVSKLPAGSSSGSESLDWADQRVLLYLAMEAKRSEQATELLKSAVKRSLGVQERSVGEGRLDAMFLGVLCALAKADSSSDRIDPQVVSKAIEAMAKHPRKSLASAFGESYQGTATHIAQLESSMNSVGNLSDSEMAAELSKAKSRFDKAVEALKDAFDALAEGKKQAQNLDKGITAAKKLSMQIYHTLINTEEPGRPQMPVPPSKPNTEIKRDSKGKEINRTPPSQTEMNDYNRALNKYQAELQSYPFRLADWARRNEARQQRLASELMAAKVRLEALEVTDKEQAEIVRELTATHSQKQQDHADAQRHLRGIEFAKEQRSDPGSFKGIYRPSLYRSIDWGSESDRLLKELR